MHSYCFLFAYILSDKLGVEVAQHVGVKQTLMNLTVLLYSMFISLHESQNTLLGGNLCST